MTASVRRSICCTFLYVYTTRPYTYIIYIYKICMYENGCMYIKEKDCMNVCVGSFGLI